MPNTDPIFSSPGASASRPKRRAALWVSVATILAGTVAAALFLAARPQKETLVLKNFSSAGTERRTIRDIVAVSGVLELSRKEIVTSPGTGVVEQVFVDAGSVVAAGEALLRIDTGDLETTLETKRLALEKMIRQAEQSDAERRFSRRQYELDISKAERTLADASSEWEKAKVLRLKNLVSDADLTKAETTERNARDALEQANLKQEQAETLYQLNLKNAQVDRSILEAEIAELRKDIAAYTVRSVRGGTVYSVNVDAGKKVSMYEELAVVADPSDSRAALDIPETRIASVSVGLPVTVYVGDGTYQANIETVAPSASSSSSSAGSVVRATAAFQTKPAKPTIGGSISAEIVAGTIKDALVLPRGPYLTSGNYALAYVVSGGTAQKRAVKYGIADGTYIQVLSGLDSGETVIVSDYRDFIHLESFPVNPGK
jgi:HlyD family secretion protein